MMHHANRLCLWLLILAAAILLLAALVRVAEAPESEVMPNVQRPGVQETRPRDMTPPPEMGAEVDLLAALIHAEAAGEPFTGKVAVGAVVLNRVADDRWPDSIEEVIHQRINGRPQFCTSGSLPEPCEDALQAAREAWAGVDPSNAAVFFYNPAVSRCGWIVTREQTARVGQHVFAR